MRVYIVGAGPGDAGYLTGEARQAIAGADRVITTPRLAACLGHLNPATVGVATSALGESVREAGATCSSVAVLVSGDPGFFSAARQLADTLPDIVPDIETHCLCGLSSLQYFCSRIGLGYERMKAVSLHGRQGNIIPHVCYNPEVFALTGGEIRAHTVIADLVGAGLGSVAVSVGEHLGSPDGSVPERIVSGTAKDLLSERFADLACLVVRNAHWVNPHESISDSAFIRGDAPMTKRAVRAVALSLLNINPGDTVLDIGAGTGAVTVEMARRASAGMVFAVEREPAALALLEQNRDRFGAFNITIVPGHAPDALEALPPADRVFVGGSGGNLGKILCLLTDRNPRVEFVVTAITLETLHEASRLLTDMGRTPEIMCINAATAHKTGPWHLMKAENPVHIIRG